MKLRPFALLSFLSLIVLLLVGWVTVRHSVRPSARPPVARDAQMPPHVRQTRAARTTPSSTPRPTKTPTPRPTSTPSPVPPAQRNVVLIVLDGAQPGLFDIPNIPHIRALEQNGVRYTDAWAGILESETPSGHAAIGTGSPPKDDGILSFDWGDSDNTRISIFDPQKIDDHYMEGIMANAGAPSIAGEVHLRYPSARVAALSGSKYYAVDAIGGPHADALMYFGGTPNGHFAPRFVPGHAPPAGVITPGLSYPTTRLPHGIEDRLAMRLAENTFTRMHARVLLVNMPEFDWPLGHVRGGLLDRPLAVQLIRSFDRDLGHLEDVYRRAGALRNTDFVLLADHGMSEIRHTVVDTQLEGAVTQAGTSLVDSTFHSASYLWVKDESKATQAALNISHLQNPYIQSVYFRAPIPGGGWEYIRATGDALLRDPGTEAANQYLLSTFNGPNGPDIAVFFTEGAASLPGGEAAWHGDHGGADWNSQHLPLIISGPGVRHGVTSSYPARLEDVAPTLLSLIGAPHTGMKGIVLADAMRAPTPAQQAAQSALRARLMPFVRTLKHESQLELAAAG